MTRLQHELLSLISEHTRFVENDASRGIEGYWYPPHAGTQWCNALKRNLFISGAGIARSIWSMVDRGWLLKNPNAFEGTYSVGITEEGCLAMEKHREATGFYVGGQ